MTDQEINGRVEVPKPDNWPGTMASYRTVKQYIKPQIWNFVSVIGMTIALSLVFDIVISIIIRHGFVNTLVNQLIGILIGAIFQAVVITMYFKSLNDDEFSLNEIIIYGYNRMLKMAGLLIVMYILLIASFIALIVPFFFVLPRLYLAPYFLIYNDSTVSEAFAASWHLTKGHAKPVYGILLLDIAFAFVALTIIGIPFAVYWYTINSGSFALLTMSLANPKKSGNPKSKKSVAKISPA